MLGNIRISAAGTPSSCKDWLAVCDSSCKIPVMSASDVEASGQIWVRDRNRAEEIAELNDIAVDASLRPGQKLKIIY